MALLMLYGDLNVIIEGGGPLGTGPRPMTTACAARAMQCERAAQRRVGRSIGSKQTLLARANMESDESPGDPEETLTRIRGSRSLIVSTAHEYYCDAALA